MPIPFLVKSVKNLSSKNNNFIFSWPGMVQWWSMNKSRGIYRRIRHLLAGKKVLDFGFGAGTIGKLLIDHGYDVTGVDVVNLSIYSDLSPVLYDGRKLPFKNKEFDTAIIIHVLHHCQDPLAALQEVARCAKRVIFIEDTYRNTAEKALVSFNDQVGNFEFYPHPYLPFSEWKKVLKKFGYKIISQSDWYQLSPIGLPSRYCLFAIESV